MAQQEHEHETGRAGNHTPNITDRFFHALQARLFNGLSPATATMAYMDWLVGLANAPGKQNEVAVATLRKQTEAWYALLAESLGAKPAAAETPKPDDRRFRDPAWQKEPFRSFSQSFLIMEDMLHNEMTGVEGVSRHNEQIVDFAARQALDALSPSNFVATNPEVLRKTMQTGGMNLVKGFQNYLADATRLLKGKPPAGVENFPVGKVLAVTPGKVVYRNHLIELIQYSPATRKVHADPILIVPNWIMKYYILDLSPHNSMVRYLVEQGHTVFMISWRNPSEADRDLSMDDYMKLGPLAALDVVRKIVPNRKVNAVGYCIGGTLLSLTAAWLGVKKKDWLGSVTLFATQVDFSEAGELTLFIDERQVDFLEDMMWDKGYLDAGQMAGAFEMLHSNQLIWSRLIHDYLMGERVPMFDLMAWNADATRMPYRMHSEYLRWLFLNNDFSAGRYPALGETISVADIGAPIFMVGAEADHVAPWHSVYKMNYLAHTDVTFLLTSGGHNAGIISEPGHAGRHYRIATRRAKDPYVAPDDWVAAHAPKIGSWWPEWQKWLAKRSGPLVAAPTMGLAGSYEPLGDAPGTYVLQK